MTRWQERRMTILALRTPAAQLTCHRRIPRARKHSPTDPSANPSFSLPFRLVSHQVIREANLAILKQNWLMELKRIVVANGHVGRKYISLVVPGALIPCELRMWEKKFGKNANHVKKQQQHATERRLPGFVPADRQSGKGNSSSRPCRTPIQSRDHEQVGKQALGRGPEGTRPSGSAKGQSEGNVNVDLRRNRPQGDRPLHPSWEAKRKQKSAGIVRSQGTKIVFSES